MPMKFLKFILSDWITSTNPDNYSDNSFSDIYKVISSSGIHYYLSGDASSDVVITCCQYST
jgi:hypothetical protein